ncbi:hypothetical protein SteCoe_37045 [Stentor coeruleus]|uniref:Protein kinase domain-containing protein n=1 Tax=Stentor coeruleus TaxID=5963 RepID=A0A1R2AP66_9CILI|nr:hypothetical protein SteCoe_37045 [Stentor coeruleus]
MLSVDLLMLVKTQFETQNVRDAFEGKCDNIFKVPLDEIIKRTFNQKNKEILIYSYSVYLLRIDQEDAQGIEILKYIRGSLVLFEYLEDMIPALIDIYDNLILKKIHECKCLENILEWVEIADILTKYHNNLMALPAAFNIFVELAYKEMLRLSLNPSVLDHIFYLKNIKKSIVYKFPIYNVALIAIGNSLDFIEQRNKFYPNELIDVDEGTDQDWEIIEKIEKIVKIYNEEIMIKDKILKENLNQVIEKLENKSSYREWKDRKKILKDKRKLNDYSEQNENNYKNTGFTFNVNANIDYNINYDDFEIIGESIWSYVDINEIFQIAIYKGNLKYEGKWITVGIKMYQEKKPDTDFSKVCREINILEKLSNIKNESFNCFTKYYGTCRINKEGKLTYYMIMEYKEKTLKDFLSREEKISEQNLERIFCQLIKSFNEMHNLGIFHLDIKPVNILTDEHFNLSIIDYDISVIKTNGMNRSSGRSNRVAGSNNYANPIIQKQMRNLEALKSYSDCNNQIYFPNNAENNSITKNFTKKCKILCEQSYLYSAADVFSLGMTLYHLMVGSSFKSGLNTDENNEELLKNVENLKPDWAKDILSGMLNRDEKKRISFKDLQKSIE